PLPPILTLLLPSLLSRACSSLPFIFYTPPAPPSLYPLSLHDALPILALLAEHPGDGVHHVRFPAAIRSDDTRRPRAAESHHRALDRKSTRLNSSHGSISYAVFCLKKKKKKKIVKLVHQC